MAHYLGIDIGASTVKLGLYSRSRGIIGERKDYPSRAGEGPETTMSVIKEAAAALFEEHNLAAKDLVAAGVCCPTPIDPDGMCVYPTNIDDSWRGVNVRDLVSSMFDVPAVLLNDGDAAAYREYSVRQSADRHSGMMAQLITGTGLGGAIILKGDILSGPLPATELGHIQTDSSDEAESCGCGSRGCAEGKSSLIGLANLVRRIQREITSDPTRSLPPQLEGDGMAVAKTLRKLVQHDDVIPEVDDIWRTYFRNLGVLARIVVNSFGTDLIVISGGAQEREETAGDTAYETYKTKAINWVRQTMEEGFPHMKQVKLEWAMDEIPDSASFGSAQYAAEKFPA